MSQENVEILSRNYCFDISGIVDFVGANGKYTGIQRVVAMSAWSFYEILPIEQKSNVYVGFTDRLADQYKCIPFSQVRDFIKDADMLSEVLSIKNRQQDSKDQARVLLKKYRSSTLKYYFHLWRLDILSLLGKDAPFIKYNTNSSGWRKIRKGSVRTEIDVSKAKSINSNDILKPEDVLFLLDAAWQSSHINQIKRMALDGVKTLTMVHDLIPLKMTGYTDPSIPNSFVNWLLHSTENTTAYLAVSKSTRKDLCEFLKAMSVDKNVHVIPLVQHFDCSKEVGSALGALTDKIPKHVYPDFQDVVNIDSSIKLYGKTPFILCVGTLEVRKNPMRLLQAWKQLIERSSGDIPKLVFAGRMGWLVDDFKKALEASGNLDGYIDIIKHPNDEELAFLYRNCLFTVMPSLYEGWGLPVGEALSFGKTAVIANNSSLPEVGQDLVEYCDANSVSSITNAVWKLVSEPENRILLENKIKNATLRNWHDVGKDLREIVEKF